VADYTPAIRRAQGGDPLVPQPLSPGRKRKMATPDIATMRNLQKQGKAMPPQQPGGRPRFQIRNADDLDNAIRAVGRVRPATDEARAKVRRYIIARAKALGLTSRLPDTWNSDGDLITPKAGSKTTNTDGDSIRPANGKAYAGR
jgi:hypothetical protein